jgi:plasmid stabilization system protein ParE
MTRVLWSPQAREDQSEAVEIVRIVHGYRDLSRIF